MVIVILQEWWGLVGNEFAALLRSHQWAQAQVRPPPPHPPKPHLPFALFQAYRVPTGVTVGFACDELSQWDKSQAPKLSLTLCLLPIALFSPPHTLSPLCLAPQPQSLWQPSCAHPYQFPLHPHLCPP